MNPSYLGRWNPNQVSGYEACEPALPSFPAGCAVFWLYQKGSFGEKRVDAVARMWIMVAEVRGGGGGGGLPFRGRVGGYQILGFTPGCSGSRAQRFSTEATF